MKAAWPACTGALVAMPNVSIRSADEDTRCIEAGFSVSLWSRGEDLRISLLSAGEAETQVEISTDTKQQLKRKRNRRNYDDLECAVRHQIARLTV